jgi:phenylalanyl-tRNA synthetase alpha chain
MADYKTQLADALALLRTEFDALDDKPRILRSSVLKGLYEEIKNIPAEDRAGYGQAVNELKTTIQSWLKDSQQQSDTRAPIDVTAPFDVNVAQKLNTLFSPRNGSTHPIMSELNIMLDIFQRMGFEVVESRLIDDDYHMFGALNFPEGHPARDEMDTFMLEDKDKNGKPLIAPAHTSTMRQRVLSANAAALEAGKPIAAVVPGRVFRNEDLDARHEHTFYQIEGIYVSKGVTVGNLISTLKEFMQEYYKQEIDVKTQPFYFPFTEPSFEFAQSCPFCQKKGCSVCSHSGWIELLGCGMIHPNVLKEGGIDPTIYTGFAWGLGFMRMVMIKYGIEDIRHFESGKLDFLRQFS